jgi:hypothetical protein
MPACPASVAASTPADCSYFHYEKGDSDNEIDADIWSPDTMRTPGQATSRSKTLPAIVQREARPRAALSSRPASAEAMNFRVRIRCSTTP